MCKDFCEAKHIVKTTNKQENKYTKSSPYTIHASEFIFFKKLKHCLHFVMHGVVLFAARSRGKFKKCLTNMHF